MCYKNQSEIDQIAMDAWMDEFEQQFLDDSFIEEAAARDAESKFDYFQEFWK